MRYRTLAASSSARSATSSSKADPEDVDEQMESPLYTSCPTRNSTNDDDDISGFDTMPPPPADFIDDRPTSAAINGRPTNGVSIDPAACVINNISYDSSHQNDTLPPETTSAVTVSESDNVSNVTHKVSRVGGGAGSRTLRPTLPSICTDDEILFFPRVDSGASLLNDSDDGENEDDLPSPLLPPDVYTSLQISAERRRRNLEHIQSTVAISGSTVGVGVCTSDDSMTDDSSSVASNSLDRRRPQNKGETGRLRAAEPSGNRNDVTSEGGVASLLQLPMKIAEKFGGTNSNGGATRRETVFTFDDNNWLLSQLQQQRSELTRSTSVAQEVSDKRRKQKSLAAKAISDSDQQLVKKRFYDKRKLYSTTESFVLYFDVFANPEDADDKVTINATKGTTLGQAIAGPLERHGLTTDLVDIFIEYSKTPLPLNSDCYRLANSVLHVRAKVDYNKSQLSTRSTSMVSIPTMLSSKTKEAKTQASNAKNKKKPASSSEDGGSYTDVSPYASLSRQAAANSSSAATGSGVSTTVTSLTGSMAGSGAVPGSHATSGATTGLGSSLSTTTAASLTVPGLSGGTSGFDSMRMRSSSNASKHSKLPSIFSSPFTKTQDKQEQLSEILAGYSRTGLPRMPDLLTLGRPHYDPMAFQLERHWTDIVACHDRLSKRQRDHQEAVWELLSTEIEYIRKLRVIIDLFMCCLFNLQSEQLLNEIEVEKVFSNVADVFYATCHFWVSHMCQMLRQARKTKEMLDPCLLKAGFLVFDKIFEPYTQYCLEQDTCREYIKTKMAENDLFRQFVTWAEMQKQCNRLKLVDLIVKPWQRLTKYKLLLHAVRKPLDRMASEAAAALAAAAVASSSSGSHSQRHHAPLHHTSTSDFEEQREDLANMWAEQLECCRGLRLPDLLSSPWQRVPRYRLLLRSILKQSERCAAAAAAAGQSLTGSSIPSLPSTDPGSIVGIDALVALNRQKHEVKEMIENVEKFLHHVNVSMRQRHNDQQLSQVADRIESYDAVDAPSDECVKVIVNEFCKLDLTCPVPGCGQQETRILLLEGALKLKDKDSKADVYCFLFTDMLLITKPAAKRAGDKVKVIKPPMRLDKIVVCPLRDIASFLLLYLNEYHIAQAVFTMHGDSKLWLDGITKAQTDYRRKRCEYLGRSDSMLLYDNICDAEAAADDDDVVTVTSNSVANDDIEVGFDRQTSINRPLVRVTSFRRGRPSSPDNFMPSVASGAAGSETSGASGTASTGLVRSPSKVGGSSSAAGSRSPMTKRPPQAKTQTSRVEESLTSPLRQPRPRSAILMSRDQFLYSDIGSSGNGDETTGVDGDRTGTGSPSPRTKSHDDAEMSHSPTSAAALGDYLTVPLGTTTGAASGVGDGTAAVLSSPLQQSISSWYRTEVATNVVATSQPMAVDLGRTELVSHYGIDVQPTAPATATFIPSGSRNVRISKRPPLPLSRSSGFSIDSGTGRTEVSVDDVLAVDDYTPSPSSVANPSLARFRQASVDEADNNPSFTTSVVTVRPSNRSIDIDEPLTSTVNVTLTGNDVGDGSTVSSRTESWTMRQRLPGDDSSEWKAARQRDIPRLSERTGSGSRDDSMDSQTDSPSGGATPTERPRFTLWTMADGGLVTVTDGAVPARHRRRMTSAERARQQRTKELVLTNPALEVSEV